MKSVFGDINEYFSYIQPEVESLPTNSFPSTSSGYLERSSVQDDDYFIRIITNEVGEFVVENIRTELNIQLRITIVISLILAILLTVSMVAFAVIWLLDSFQKLSQKSQHFWIYTFNYIKNAGLFKSMKKTRTAKVTPASQKKSGLYNKLNEEKDEDDKAA